MAVIMCHGLKGGAGVTFVAAQIAMMLSETARAVTLLSLSKRDTMPFHFGLAPGTELPSLFAPAEDGVKASGVSLRKYTAASSDPDFIPALEDLGYLQADSDKVMVIDVPSHEMEFIRRLVPYAHTSLCVLNAGTDTLALIPQILSEANVSSVVRTTFAINALDETRRLSRHSAAFIRELAGTRLIGRIRYDEAVPEAIAMMKPLERYAPASVALADVRALTQSIVTVLDAPLQMPTHADLGVAPSSSRAA